MNYSELIVKQSFMSGDKKIVLFDPDSVVSIAGQFKNLVCFEEDGGVFWVAELPTSDNTATYSQIVSTEPLVVDSFCSIRCTINTENGRILEQVFFK